MYATMVEGETVSERKCINLGVLVPAALKLRHAQPSMLAFARAMLTILESSPVAEYPMVLSTGTTPEQIL